MLTAKDELLAALAAELQALCAGAGAKAAVELPQGAGAEGVLSFPAARQWEKTLHMTPRQMAEKLRSALLATPAFQRWVSDIDIAGPGFINIRLKPAARQAVVSEVLAAGARFGCQPPNGQRVLVEFVSANPTGPLHVGH